MITLLIWLWVGPELVAVAAPHFWVLAIAEMFVEGHAIHALSPKGGRR